MAADSCDLESTPVPAAEIMAIDNAIKNAKVVRTIRMDRGAVVADLSLELNDKFV
jgi:hypothetical protein